MANYIYITLTYNHKNSNALLTITTIVGIIVDIKNHNRGYRRKEVI
nr:MAG TPA: hypothetical protein [Caudoviricetes sp.]